MFEAIGNALWSIPAPTEYWAEIIGDVIWPITILAALYCFRSSISAILIRLAFDDIDAGNFKFRSSEHRLGTAIPTPEEPFIQGLEPQFDDPDVMETLFEYIADHDNFVMLSQWVHRNIEPKPEVDQFFTAPQYEKERLRAVKELIWEKKDG